MWAAETGLNALLLLKRHKFGGWIWEELGRGVRAEVRAEFYQNELYEIL